MFLGNNIAECEIHGNSKYVNEGTRSEKDMVDMGKIRYGPTWYRIKEMMMGVERETKSQIFENEDDRGCIGYRKLNSYSNKLMDLCDGCDDSRPILLNKERHRSSNIHT